MLLFFRKEGLAVHPPAGIVFVAGLKAEAALIKTDVVIGGGDRQGARRAVGRAIASGATALVSFGLAGGLSPKLRPGDLVVPGHVAACGRRFAADPALSAALGGVTAEAVLGGETIVTGATEKARLWRAHGAEIVDLESAAVAELAAAAGLPFAVLRAVCDPAWRDLPPAAELALDRAGAIGLGRVLGSLARQPRQISGLLALARDAALARSALRTRLAQLRRDRRLRAWQGA